MSSFPLHTFTAAPSSQLGIPLLPPLDSQGFLASPLTWGGGLLCIYGFMPHIISWAQVVVCNLEVRGNCDHSRGLRGSQTHCYPTSALLPILRFCLECPYVAVLLQIISVSPLAASSSVFLLCTQKLPLLARPPRLTPSGIP